MEEKELNEIVVVEQLPIIKEKLQIISDEIDKEVKNALALECKEETKNEVKNARAKLNKIKTTLEDKRKQVKNAVMNPYNEFEVVYNELVKEKLNNADEILKNRIDLIENTQKEAKEQELRRFVEEHCEANNVHVDFEVIGLNITLSASEKALKEQAKAFIEKVAADLKLIEQEEFSSEILYEYNKSFDYVDAKTKVLQRHKELEEIQKQQEEKQNKENNEEQIIENVEKEIEITAPVEEDEIIEVGFTLRGKISDIKKVKDFIIELGIEYE